MRAFATKQTPAQEIKSTGLADFGWQVSPRLPAVSRRQSTCPCGGGCPNCLDKHHKSLAIQKKSLEISRPADADEREADDIARKVVDGQPAEIRETGAALGRSGAGSAKTSSEFHSALENSKGGGRSLDNSTRREMESKMGVDLSGVRIHTGGDAHKMNEDVSAKAFTHGQDIFFRQGEFDTGSRQGKELLAHELVHTVQQTSEKIQRKAGAEDAKKNEPNPIIPIRDLIAYIRIVEKAYPDDDYQGMLARLRVLYYGNEFFEFIENFKFKQLLPNSPIYEKASYNAPWNPSYMEIKGISKIRYAKGGEKAFQDLNAHAHENAKKDEEGDNPSPYIKLDNGEEIDFGHLLLALDALSHPIPGIPYTTYGVPSQDPAAHVADLGIAVVWMTHHEDKKEPHSKAPIKLASPNLDEYYKMSAPEQDLLGDVDAFALYQSVKPESPQSPKNLSDIIESYYLKPDEKNKHLVDQRWKNFMIRAGWGYKISGTTVTLNPEVIETLLKKVKYFADLYEDGLFTVVEVSNPFTVPKRRPWKYATLVVDKFLRFVKLHLEQEIAREKTK